MMRLRATRLSDGSWVASNPEHAPLVQCFDATTEKEAIERIFPLLDELLPGIYRSTPTLEEAKADRFEAIDATTDAIVASGFAYVGLRFSLSTEAQSRFLTMLTAADLLSYPIYYNSLDDRDRIELRDATESKTFVLTALGTIRAYLDAGTALKDLVRAAETVEAVEAVRDDRLHD